MQSMCTRMPTKRRRVQVPGEGETDKKKVSGIQREKDVVSSKYFPSMNTRLLSDFYNKPCINLAKSFLGQILVRRLPDGTELRGRIVETESYLGGEDEASHSRGGEGAAVLLRSLEPIEGLDAMRNFRNVKRNIQKPLKDKELCNGPSKLCQAFAIEKTFDRQDLADDQSTWLEAGPEVQEEDIVSCARIGISNAGEWTRKPLRFYIKNNMFVSVRDKMAETSGST
ncbi:DNA-3-methyladenine glycosylase isoform X2 [Engystomops pustulosus]|uniref:DNA-3-methyladenine glycosylase isoform X2 n=1 Tax=Engystomops pustulosus TaxID=76066 RepID=UPI003AFAF140